MFIAALLFKFYVQERYQQKHRRDIKLEVLTSDDEAKVVTCSAKEETLQVLEEMAEFGEDRESTRVIAAVVQLCCSIVMHCFVLL